MEFRKRRSITLRQLANMTPLKGFRERERIDPFDWAGKSINVRFSFFLAISRKELKLSNVSTFLSFYYCSHQNKRRKNEPVKNVLIYNCLVVVVVLILTKRMFCCCRYSPLLCTTNCVFNPIKQKSTRLITIVVIVDWQNVCLLGHILGSLSLIAYLLFHWRLVAFNNKCCNDDKKQNK